MSKPAAQCPHEGDPDFYGLGIRIGIYLQLTTAVVAKCFHPEAIPENLTANTIFLLALFAALVIATLGPGLRPEEIYILLQLCFGFLLSVLSILGGRRPSPSGHSATPRPPPVASYFRLMLTLAICAYSVWFWFPGKDKMKVAGCASYMFFFTSISLFGGVPVVYQIQSAILIVPLGVLFTWYSFVLLWFSVSSFLFIIDAGGRISSERYAKGRPAATHSASTELCHDCTENCTDLVVDQCSGTQSE
ncbi:MAG: hypothetical protein Q9215_000353 [Flavoplaca cf. flavocitrina]